jgi:uncharacterized protein YukE
MARAIVDPNELRRFAQGLKHFNHEMNQLMAVLQSGFQALGDTWRDQEQKKFAEEFVQTMQVLTRFLEASNQQIPFLLRKAERIDEYLRQR